jgi:hypothetical protein
MITKRENMNAEHMKEAEDFNLCSGNFRQPTYEEMIESIRLPHSPRQIGKVSSTEKLYSHYKWDLQDRRTVRYNWWGHVVCEISPLNWVQS